MGIRKKPSNRAGPRGPGRHTADVLRVRSGAVKLSKWDADSTPGILDREEAAERLAANLERVDELQYGLYAEGRRSLLLVFQGMDGAGKDGVIRKVATAFNTQGCRAWSFKAPTPVELATISCGASTRRRRRRARWRSSTARTTRTC